MAKGVKTGGRGPGTPNKSTSTLKDLARKHTEAALNTLVTVMTGGAAIPAAAQVAAAKELLDRGYGKASQVLSGDEDNGPIKVIHSIKLVGPDAS
jgi:hypothetical protein